MKGGTIEVLVETIIPGVGSLRGAASKTRSLAKDSVLRGMGKRKGVERWIKGVPSPQNGG